ncbi:MBL fold metallo-hydrolase [candidate division KSB1 bacterium]|nr:MBL fold metallo-hydrolase [candidate division KSB1 bacterium]NIR72041.1 MBL fold metallo-hydrolase [candidate division KSB1 bacterium]NIS25982.1 MBL fold metallo-hydrolase [candidate division KSB1 bacterium]NIT74953.1 MBL fold metallo-hydrolase [candidate division KSB1 bacterium]NIU28737.1 MBL fold metallo-hydrolase [candidate division KSB1 bacterium]
MAGNHLSVRFWGVRGSYPVPGEDIVKYGGNTSCVEIRANDHTIILDAGTGIVNLGHKLAERTPASKHLDLTILLSHTHHDHIQGLPFFRPAFRPNCTLRFYGPKILSKDLEPILRNAMSPQYSPIELEELKSSVEIQNINENNILVFSGESEPTVVTQNEFDGVGRGKVIVRLLRSYGHPKVGVFIYKIEANGKSVVYASDTEGYVGGDARLIDFARNASLLIHDAQYTPEEYLNKGFPKQGFGHSTYEMAADVAKSANVEHLVLFHHDPTHTDAQIAEMEVKTCEIFPNSKAGAEGLEFTF